MRKRALAILLAAVVAAALAACNKSGAGSGATPTPVAAATEDPFGPVTPMLPGAAEVVQPPLKSACGEITAALAASDAGYRGWSDASKPAKSGDGHAGFEAVRTLPNVPRCVVVAEGDPSWSCELAPAASPDESGSVLRGWRAKLDHCAALKSLKKTALGADGIEWSDDTHSVRVTLSGKDAAKPVPVIVVSRRR